MNSMDGWELTRTAITLAALMISAAALFFARKDRFVEVQKSALDRIEKKLVERIDADRKLSDERHGTNVQTLSAISSRLAAGDEVMKALPTNRDLDMLRVAINETSREVARLEGSTTASTRMVERLNAHLMEKGLEKTT